ncbi:Octanoyltransferase LipM [Thalassoglobus neptunius]|uniref:Octanoyltransferase LipM n=1 Tax=Thalassoglobus neptunius TaxID=1938619 RepID=A0A5C5X2R4_9PLAN|nr:lipoate--protein ligase [Thalassoglobus neptunius]TWT56889.1 Octanoyltransferase LipM [Thalassoglobus neptunius]
MLPMTPCRLIRDAAQSGKQNMAVDAEMLRVAVEEDRATVRTYFWSEPTVSLGHFQAREPVSLPNQFRDLPVVRRLSGGGAILHHHELTYSIALPKSHSLREHPTQLYEVAHEVIIHLLADAGIEARMRGDDAFEDESFLCFLRGDARDIVIGTNKIVGSAQRRRQGAILQHGSLLLSRSNFAPELPGVTELTGIELPVDRFADRFLGILCERLRLSPEDH